METKSNYAFVTLFDPLPFLVWAVCLQLITWSRQSSFPWSPFFVSFPSSLSFATNTGRGKQVNTFIFLCNLLSCCLWWCHFKVHVVAISCLRLIFIHSNFQQYQTEGLSSNPKASVDGQVVDITGRTHSNFTHKDQLTSLTVKTVLQCLLWLCRKLSKV